jgi:hypothetical protein
LLEGQGFLAALEVQVADRRVVVGRLSAAASRISRLLLRVSGSAGFDFAASMIFFSFVSVPITAMMSVSPLDEKGSNDVDVSAILTPWPPLTSGEIPQAPRYRRAIEKKLVVSFRPEDTDIPGKRKQERT